MLIIVSLVHFSYTYISYDSTCILIDISALYGSLDPPDTGMDSIPRQHQLAPDVKHFTQLINMHKIRAAEIKLRGDKPSPIDLGMISQ